MCDILFAIRVTIVALALVAMCSLSLSRSLPSIIHLFSFSTRAKALFYESELCTENRFVAASKSTYGLHSCFNSATALRLMCHWDKTFISKQSNNLVYIAEIHFLGLGCILYKIHFNRHHTLKALKPTNFKSKIHNKNCLCNGNLAIQTTILKKNGFPWNHVTIEMFIFFAFDDFVIKP